MKKIFRLIREAWENIEDIEDVFEFFMGAALGVIILILISLLIVVSVWGFLSLLTFVF